MKSFNSLLSNCPVFIQAAIAAAALVAASASAQLVAYDDAGNYLVSANWTNGANQGFGFTPWAIATNGPDAQGTYIGTVNSPTFVIASLTNVLGTNYTNIFGLYANGTNDVNEVAAFRGFASSLGTNTFKVQWGSRGAGATTTVNSGVVHGLCGFSLRNGNATNSSGDYQTGALLYVYFKDGNAPSTLYVADGSAGSPISVTGTSFSDLGRANITNAIESEVTVAPDGNHYHLVLKDCVANRTLYTLDSVLAGTGTVDSVALFCHETTGDQIYNRLQIASPVIPPTIVNVQPTNGSIYVPAATQLSFEVDSFNSTVAPGSVNVYLNGVLQGGSVFNTSSPSNQLLGTNNAVLAPDTFYNYTITAQDANGNTVSNVYTFNTFLTSDLYIDASDYNYNSGLFVNSSTPANAYLNLLGTNGIDYSISDLTGTNNTAGYRPGDLPQILTLPTDATGDPIDHANLRLSGYTAYNIGFTDISNWENYTRTIPTPTNYSIYARAASAGTGQFEIERLVNSAATTTNQPLIALGRVNVPTTGGSKVYSGQLDPLTDIFGNTVVVPLSGVTTLRTTAISSRGYNLEYFVVVAVTNATSTLKPYIATGSPVPNATGVALSGQITFTIANRQTTVATNTIKLLVNSTNETPLLLSNNAAGVVVTYNLASNLPANATNTVTVIFNDNTGTNSTTNSWTFVTAGSGGILGNAVWSGGAGLVENWSAAANWTGGTPGPGFSATFASPGATTTLATNNIIDTNFTILQLNYTTNNSGFHTTAVASGVTLTVTNGAVTTGTQALQVGGAGNGADNVFNQKVTNTITGSGGTVQVLGNALGSGLVNSLNFQVRQSANTAAPEQTVLDMSGLGTLIATVGKLTVGQGGSGTGQSNVSGRLNLAMTNTITLLRTSTTGLLVVGDSSGGAFTLAGSTLNLGITNALYFGSANIGNRRATNALVRFNPIFTNNAVPAAYIRNTNGPSSRVTAWNIGYVNGDTTGTPVYNSGTVDFSGGTVDALVGTMIVGGGSTVTADTGYAQGTLTLTAGTFNVSNLLVGVQYTNNAASVTGTVNVNGTASLVSTNNGITLAQSVGGSGPTLGTLNITNGSFQGYITAGSGTSSVNLNGGTLTVPGTGTVGTSSARLTTLNLTGGTLHLNVNGAASTAIVNAASVSASGSTILIDSVTNVTGTTTIHLLSYTGIDPYAGLSLGAVPYGYAGSLVDNSGNSSIDLTVMVAPLPPSPTIGSIVINGGHVIISGSHNSDVADGGYSILTTTNIALPLTNWTLLNRGNFDASGNFSSTNATGTNRQQFYILRLP